MPKRTGPRITLQGPCGDDVWVGDVGAARVAHQGEDAVLLVDWSRETDHGLVAGTMVLRLPYSWWRRLAIDTGRQVQS